MDSASVRTVHRWLTVAGGGLVVGAIVLVGVAYVDSSLLEALRRPGDDVVLVVGFFTVAVVAGSVLLTVGLIVEESDSSAREPETTPPVPRVGADLDRLDANPLWARRLSGDERRRTRDRLHRTTVRTIRRVENVSRREAEDRVERGTWTEDATAAAFLGDSAPPPSTRFCGRVSDRIAFRRGVRKTVRAILRYEERGADQ